MGLGGKTAYIMPPMPPPPPPNQGRWQARWFDTHVLFIHASAQMGHKPVSTLGEHQLEHASPGIERNVDMPVYSSRLKSAQPAP